MSYMQVVEGLYGLYKNHTFPSYGLGVPAMASISSTVRHLAKIAFTSQVALFSSTSVSAGSPPSCTNPQTSCMNTSVVADTCCFNAPGGQLLQTQFWDYSPPTGPSDSWTIHGLWPDHCDGTYDANCDPARAYTNISAIISAAGATDLLSYMKTYWKDYQGNDESFWEHEWGKHGTCISTLNPSCYTDYTPQQEVVDFFQKTVDLFKTLPSYTWLSDAGIVPDSSATYTSAQILAALNTPRGVDAVIQCQNTNVLDEIWYFYDVAGSVQTGRFIPTNPDGSKGDCPATGIKYLPKSGSPPSPTTATTTAAIPTNTAAPPSPTASTSPGIPFSGKGTLQVTTSNSPTGCIISAGTWYTTGTCATFTATPTDTGFTLASSKGSCGIVSGKFTCGSGVAKTVFTSAGGELVNPGSADTTWFAAGVPQGSVQQAVSESGGQTGLVIAWTSS